MKTFWVGPNVIARIETNAGVVGWGDIKGVDIPTTPASTRPASCGWTGKWTTRATSTCRAGRAWGSRWTRPG
jgi:hypothetical protein